MDAPRVLVIEDTEEILELIGISLRSAGLVPDLVANGARGIERLRETTPDAVVVDLHMPVMGGLEFCREVRDFSDVPILLISGSAEGRGRRISLEAGADEFMEKPFKPKVLVARIRELIEDRGSGRVGADQI
jgi:DNA-binding response OmpR family regulator